mgnify:CR=1 FL=1
MYTPSTTTHTMHNRSRLPTGEVGSLSFSSRQSFRGKSRSNATYPGSPAGIGDDGPVLHPVAADKSVGIVIDGADFDFAGLKVHDGPRKSPHGGIRCRVEGVAGTFIGRAGIAVLGAGMGVIGADDNGLEQFASELFDDALSHFLDKFPAVSEKIEGHEAETGPCGFDHNDFHIQVIVHALVGPFVEVVFGSDADHLADRPAEGHLFRDFDLAIIAVNTAVEHPVQIEGFFLRQFGDDTVDRQGDQHGENVDLVGIDGEFDRIHLPDYIRIHRLGNGFQNSPDGRCPASVNQKGIDVVGPVPLDGDAAKGQHHAGDQRRKRAFGISETTVKTEDHHRSAAAHPHHAHDRHEQVDVVQLGHEQAADAIEETNANGYEAEHPDVLLRSRRLLHERQDHVLGDRQGCAEDTGIVRGDHGQDHQQTEHAHHDHWQDSVHTGSHHQLIVERTVLLELGIAFRFTVVLPERLVCGVHIWGIKVFLVGEGGVFADLMAMFGNRFDPLHEISAVFFLYQFRGDVFADVDLDLAPEFREVLMIQDRNDAEGDQQIEEIVQSGSPGRLES